MKTQKELFNLMSAQHDGLLDAAADVRLAELLAGNEDAQRYYLELGSMFHELEETFHGHCAHAVVKDFPSRRAKVIPLFGWVVAIAASLVAIFMLVPQVGRERSALLVDSDATILLHDDYSSVARVLHSDGIVWGPDNAVAIQNGELKHGLLDLEQGSLDIVFDNGVRLGFVGPVKMDLSSLHRLSLESGAVVVDIPGLSEGLMINTPDGVLKANTVLAHIQCGPDSPTLVSVDRGALNLFAENHEGLEIRKNMVGKESVELVRGSQDPIVETRRMIEPRIDLSQPPELENLQYAHYRFDNMRNSRVRNFGTIPGGDGVLEGIAAYPEYPAPRKVTGRFNQALEFSGHGEGMIADLKDFGTDEPGSVAFWIKLDPSTVPAPYETIFTWRMYTDPEKQWHSDDEEELACSIHINDKPENGVVGAVWIAFRNKWICGTQDLRDGRWHHVTAVFHRGYQGTIVRHYIDGQLARSSARGETWYPNERYSEIGGGSIAVGRVYWPERPDVLKPTDSVGLHGMVDELYVFNQAVLPSHASSLYMENSPNQRVEVSFVPLIPGIIAMKPVPLGE